METKTIEQTPEMEIIWMPVEDLIPYENNPRYTDDAVEPVAKSIEEFGWRQPIVVDTQNVIIIGHVRRLAALKRGWKRVPVHVAKDLPPEKIKALRLADNRTGELAKWDFNLLQLEISELEEMNFSMEDLGFSDEEFEQMLKDSDPVLNGKTDPDRLPDVPTESDSVSGKVYLLGNHRLMCGDSTSQADIIRLMNGKEAELWITDPPYNVDYESESGLKIQNDNMTATQFDSFLMNSFTLAAKVLKSGSSYYIFHSDNWGLSFRQATLNAGLHLRQCLVWVKNNIVMGRQDYQWQHESCLYGWKDGAPHGWFSDRKQSTVINLENNPFVKRDDGKYQLQIGNKTYVIEANAVCEEVATSVIEFPKPVKSDVHPTMKPVDLLIYLIKNSTQRGNLLLDTFGGSGSTLIAAEQTGRIAYLMELDEHYCDVIRKRYAEFKYGEGCDWRALTPAEA